MSSSRSMEVEDSEVEVSGECVTYDVTDTRTSVFVFMCFLFAKPYSFYSIFEICNTVIGSRALWGKGADYKADYVSEVLLGSLCLFVYWSEWYRCEVIRHCLSWYVDKLYTFDCHIYQYIYSHYPKLNYLIINNSGSRSCCTCRR